jgi:tetratricopeptide (TPR) repeat protein
LAEAPSPRQRADGLIERSKSLSEIGRWKDAEVQARRAVEVDPSHARARLQLAHVLMALGRGNEAADLAKGVLAQEPSSAWAIRILGNWHGAQGRHGEAVALAEEAVRLSDGDRIALLYLSYAKRDASDLVGSRIAAERIVSEYPDWPDGFVRLAETRHSPEEAAQAYRAALRLDPHCDAALAGLAGLSGSLAQYREAVSLAWSSLRSDVADTTRQRFFARSAWIYLALSRIVAPLRGTHRALAEPFGEPCALAFRATGPNVAARLLFAFRFEALVLAIWAALAAAMLGATYLPGALSDVLVPLLGIPVFLGLAIPFFMFFGVIAAARRLLDLRIVQWAGRGSLGSLLARAAVSGAMLFGLTIVLLLLWPSWVGLWGWILMMSIVLMVQDLSRWRDQWRDSRRTMEAGSTRQQVAAAISERAQRWFTPARLAAFLAGTLVAEVALRGIEKSIEASDPPATAIAALGALICYAIDFGTRRFAARCEPGPRADRWRALGRTLMELAWMVAAVTAMVAIGGRLLEGNPIEALYPILLLPLIVGSGWLVLRAAMTMIAVVASEAGRLVRRLMRRDFPQGHPTRASGLDRSPPVGDTTWRDR